MTASELAEARRQAASERKARTAAEAKLQEIERAQLSEQERLKADLDSERKARVAAEEREKAARLEALLLRAAPRHNLLPAAYGAALKLLDVSLLDWQEDGSPSEASVTKALKALVDAHPYLVAPATDRAPAPGPTAPAPAGNGRALTDQERAYQHRVSGQW
jgi:hypothetical protein